MILKNGYIKKMEVVQVGILNVWKFSILFSLFKPLQYSSVAQLVFNFYRNLICEPAPRKQDGIVRLLYKVYT